MFDTFRVTPFSVQGLSTGIGWQGVGSVTLTQGKQTHGDKQQPREAILGHNSAKFILGHKNAVSVLGHNYAKPKFILGHNNGARSILGHNSAKLILGHNSAKSIPRHNNAKSVLLGYVSAEFIPGQINNAKFILGHNNAKSTQTDSCVGEDSAIILLQSTPCCSSVWCMIYTYKLLVLPGALNEPTTHAPLPKRASFWSSLEFLIRTS